MKKITNKLALLALPILMIANSSAMALELLELEESASYLDPRKHSGDEADIYRALSYFTDYEV